MQLKKHANGIYYAHLTGSRPINLHTADADTARRLAKESQLEAIEFAARAKLLTAEAVQRLSAGGKVSGVKALDLWRKHAGTQAMSPKTVSTYEGFIRRYLVSASLESAVISSATEASVDAFVNAADDTGVSTRQVRLAALQHFFRFTQAKGLTLEDPAALLSVRVSELSFGQKEPKRREVFTDSDRLRLHTVEDEFWAPAILLGEEYGLRLGDVVDLEWASFEKPGALVIWTDKHDKRVEMPLLPELIGMLGARNGRYVFPKQHEMNRAVLSQQFTRLLGRLGISGKSFHCLRHTFAVHRRALGDTVDEIRLKMGHSSSSTTEGYLNHT